MVLLQLVILLSLTSWLFRNGSTGEITRPSSAPGQITLALLSTLLAGWYILGPVFTLRVRYPNVVNEDLFSGLPLINEPLTSFLFSDQGRPSYFYNLMLTTLGAVPGFEIWHLKQLYVVMGFTWIYVIYKGLDSFSVGPLLLVLAAQFQLWSILLFPFQGCRSWGTELLSLGFAMYCLSPTHISSRKWALPGALLWLGLACLDSPLEVVPFAGFLAGAILYIRAEPESQGTDAVKYLIRGGLLFLLLTIGIGLVSVSFGETQTLEARTSAIHQVPVLLQDWWESLRRSGVLAWFLAFLVLATRPPKPSWYPLIGATLFAVVISSLAPLLLSERLISTPEKVWRPMVLLTVYTTLGLGWEQVQALIRAVGSAGSEAAQRTFSYQAATVAAFVFLGLSISADPTSYRNSSAQTLLQAESASALNRHIRQRDDQQPVYVTERYLLTVLASVDTGAGLQGLRRPSVHIFPSVLPPWKTTRLSCDETADFKVVSVGLANPDIPNDQAPCPSCTVDPAFYGVSAHRIPEVDGIIRHMVEPEHYSSFEPYVLWRCEGTD